MARSNEEDAKRDLWDTIEQSEYYKTARDVVNAHKTAAKAGWRWLAGTPDDPTAWRLGAEWASGRGPEHRDLTEKHQFTQRFKDSPMVGQVRDEIYYKYDGHPPDGGSFTEFGITMDPLDEFIDPDGTWEEHFLGSFDGDAYIRDGRIYYTITNESDVHSLLFGRLIDDLNEDRGWDIPTAPAYKRDTFPLGRQTSQTITWSEPVMPKMPEELDEIRRRVEKRRSERR